MAYSTEFQDKLPNKTLDDFQSTFQDVNGESKKSFGSTTHCAKEIFRTFYISWVKNQTKCNIVISIKQWLVCVKEICGKEQFSIYCWCGILILVILWSTLFPTKSQWVRLTHTKHFEKWEQNLEWTTCLGKIHLVGGMLLLTILLLTSLILLKLLMLPNTENVT